MKKVIVLIMCFAVVIMAFSGCGDKSSDEAEKASEITDSASEETGADDVDSAQAEILNQAKSLADNLQYEEAILALEGYLRSNPEDTVVTDQLAVYQNSYAEQAIKNAAAAFVEPQTDYAEANDIISSALQKVPDHADLLAEQEYYLSFEPVLLYDMGTYKSSTYLFKYVSDTDTYGNERYNAIRSDWHTRQSGSYDLSGKYNTFTATVYGRSNDDDVYYGVLEIYGDGVCLYSNKKIAIDCRAFDISVDVTGVNDLEIVFDGQDYRAIAWFGIAEAAVQKTVK